MVMENEYDCGCIQIGCRWILCRDCKAEREDPLACSCCE